MGVTERDWRSLAAKALSVMDLEVAARAFIRVRDTRCLDVVARIHAARAAGVPENLLAADVLAYQVNLYKSSLNTSFRNVIGHKTIHTSPS